MIARAFLSAALPLGVAIAALSATPDEAAASEKDKRFFSTVEGEWSGPGEIVAGKYKGTRFTCNFKGATPNGKVGMSLDGGCRVGLFTQKMSAKVEHSGRKGYRGSFMDGSKGEGLDVIGGNVNGRKVTLTLNRNQLNGAMLANLPDDNTMHVTVSVKVASQMVPVIGMNLKRVDTRTVGAISRD
ncbi:MAG: hypothetical protein M9945_10330 [Aquamicrobium sp.]|uniref:hypothetical protein n=1 Tax=Aquamicrobium sp. TaxID=1872579 RepID=UPI00349EB672|nr:hypothetical protein [Aquamicrobium sp.]